MTFSESIDEIVATSTNGLLGKHPSWDRVRLREVAAITNGAPFPSSQFRSDHGMPLIRIRDILTKETETRYEGDYESRYLVQPGDLLVGMDGDFNSATWRGPVGLLNQRVCRIDVDESRYNKTFLRYALPGYLNAINARTSSLTVKHLSSHTVQEIPLPAPPLQTQAAIANRLEELFSDLDAGVAAVERAKVKLARYRVAILKAAVDGSLTESWRSALPEVEPAENLLSRLESERRKAWENAHSAVNAADESPGKRRYSEAIQLEGRADAALPKGWCRVTFDQCAWEITVGHVGPMKEQYLESGVPFLRSQNVRPLGFAREGLKFIPSGFHQQLSKSRLVGGELLVVRSGNIGDACVYPIGEPEANCADLVIVRAVQAVMLPEYAALIVSSPMGQQSALGRRTGSALSHFNVGAMRRSVVPLPPLAEQRQIVQISERLLTLASALDTELTSSLRQDQLLRRGVLASAFAGRLSEAQDSRRE